MKCGMTTVDGMRDDDAGSVAAVGVAHGAGPGNPLGAAEPVATGEHLHETLLVQSTGVHVSVSAALCCACGRERLQSVPTGNRAATAASRKRHGDVRPIDDPPVPSRKDITQCLLAICTRLCI